MHINHIANTPKHLCKSRQLFVVLKISNVDVRTERLNGHRPGFANNDELTATHIIRHGMIFAIREVFAGGLPEHIGRIELPFATGVKPAFIELAAFCEGISGGLIIGHSLSYLLVRQN